MFCGRARAGLGKVYSGSLYRQVYSFGPVPDRDQLRTATLDIVFTVYYM